MRMSGLSIWAFFDRKIAIWELMRDCDFYTRLTHYKPEMESKTSLEPHAPQQEKHIENPSEAEISFGFQIATGNISDLFEEVALGLGFEMIEKELHHATAIKQVKRSLLHYLDCFNWVTDGNMTAIKLAVHTSEKNSTRVCKIRGLVGSRKEVRHFIDTFRIKSAVLIKQQPFYLEESEQILDEPQNPFHLEACAAYMFHKILSNEQYGIGNTVSRSLKDFLNGFSDVEKSAKLLPLPMKNAVTIIKEIVENLYKDFNMGRKEMEKIMPYCRISVERYIFDRIQPVIAPIYSHKTAEENAIFQEKRARIFSQKKLREIFSEINLEQYNWLFEPGAEENLERVVSVHEARKSLKYRRACEQLQKMVHVESPREKMKHCQIGYSILKTLVYQGTNKKHELTNMEDIIPIFILVLLMSSLPEPKAHLDLIADFIELDGCELESERRLLLNLSESFNFVYRDWKV